MFCQGQTSLTFDNNTAGSGGVVMNLGNMAFVPWGSTTGLAWGGLGLDVFLGGSRTEWGDCVDLSGTASSFSGSITTMISGGSFVGRVVNARRPLVPAPTNNIANELEEYNKCVESSPWHEFEPEKLDVPEAPEGKDADMGVTPQDGTVPVPSNNDLFINTMKSCLTQYPMAALALGYTGVQPGMVF